METYPQGARDLQYCRKAWASVFAKSLVKTLPAQSGVAGHLRHTTCPGDVAECAGNAGGIIRSLLKPGVEIRCHLLWSTQLLRQVIGHCFGPGHPFPLGLALHNLLLQMPR